jgi:hypothetical protein
MALSILDGNQSATTLSTILSSGQHITAHTVISLGTQAITDITSAVSGTSVCVGSISISGTPSVTGSVSVLNFPASQSTTFGAVTGSVSVLNFPASQSVTFGATTGSVSVLNFPASQAVTFSAVTISNFPATQPVSLTTLPALVAGTAQIGSVTASISGTVTATVRNGEDAILNDDGSGYTAIRSLSHWFSDSGQEFRTTSENYPLPISGTVTIGSLPAISGTVTANLSESITEPIDSTNATQAIAVHIKDADGNNWGAENIFPVVASGTVTANTFALQGTAVTTSNFTSTTASTVLANYNATREVLTIFNEGAGNLHICAGATCTTIAYQVRLSAGDYYEVPNHQTTITHSAVFATAGTARVTEVS